MVIQLDIAELLARQVEHAVAHRVEAVIIAARLPDAVHFAAEQVLDQECRDRALPERFVIGRPVAPHPRRAGVRAPDTAEDIIAVARGQPVFILYRCGFMTVEMIGFHSVFLVRVW